MQSRDIWKAERKAALQAEDGWLNLIARLGLRPGTQSIGTGPACELLLPKVPAHLGSVTYGTDGAFFTPPGGATESFVPSPGGFAQ